MKKATREWVEAGVGGAWLSDDERRDILDSDKKQRATIADLKARLKSARERIDDMFISELSEPLLDVLSLLNLSNKRWRTPKGKS